MNIIITEAQVKKMIKGLHNEWKEIDDKLIRVYDFPTYKDTISFVNMISSIAEKQNHHPEMVVGYDTVKVIMFDHEEGGVSDKCHKFTDAVDDMVNKEEALDERSRSFAFTRKKRLFPKSAMRANPNRFKKYDKEVKGINEEKGADIFGHKFSDLLDSIKYEVDEPEEHIKYKFDELNQIQKRPSITLYRVVFIKNPDKLNKNNFGHHYVSSIEDYHEEMMAYLYLNALKDNKSLTEDDTYLIEIETPTSNIDYYETMRTFALHPFENEVTIKDDKVVNLISVTSFYGGVGIEEANDPKTGTGKKPEGSSRRLYTDENPSDTVSVKFKTKEDIVATLNKDSFKSKPHKRQSQIINLIHQRVRAAYQNAKDPETKTRLKRGLDYIEVQKEKSKEKTIKLRDK